MNRAAVYKQDSLSRRTFLRRSAAASALAYGLPASASTLSPDSFELSEATISGLQSAMKSGKLSARSIVEKYLDRIEKIDKQGPAVNAILELNPDALAIAEALDKERKEKGPRGPLHGIPVVVKDNIETAGRMHTTAGSLALANSIAVRDAFVITQLRRAGAVILGKTNLSEWANIRSTRSTSGWSGRGGQTKNPYALDRNPCGSSSGSAVAVAANLCSVAVGTETDGSIVCPASINGVVGIKPTVGLVSRSGIIPISHSQDTAGPFGRTVADAAILLGAMAGVDPQDAATQESKGKGAKDYIQYLKRDGLRDARIGVLRGFFGFNRRVDELMDGAIEVMKKQGAVLVDPAELPGYREIEGAELEVLLFEFKANVNTYLSRLGSKVKVHSLKEVIEFNEQNREKEMPYFGQELFLMAEAKGPLTDEKYQKALVRCRRFSREQGIDAAMQAQKLDALIAPTTGPAWKTDWKNGDNAVGGCSTPPAVAGYPHITVPAGFVGGLPVGISFFGRAWNEGTLVKLAFAFEQATRHRRRPEFRASADMPE